MAQHSEKYEKVKHYFVLGLWSVARVRNAVTKGWIAEDEFTEITGEEWQ